LTQSGHRNSTARAFDVSHFAGLRVFDPRQIHIRSVRFIVDGGSAFCKKTRRYDVQIRLAAVLADH
jgi:hypothetical protein